MAAFFFAFLAIVSAAWYVASPGISLLGQGAFLWSLRQEGLHLSGVLSLALMSLCMILSLRMPGLAKLLGGPSQAGRLHKAAGILAVAIAAGHWLIEISSDVIKYFVD